jgi:hypothetical protein
MKKPLRTPGSKSRKTDGKTLFNIQTATRMLPLVRPIMDDIDVLRNRRLSHTKELSTLDQFRLELTWVSRQRRYQIQDELEKLEVEWERLIGELQMLGLSLEDGVALCVSFPTRINDKPAVLSWKNNEEKIGYWHFAGETTRRPIANSDFNQPSV